MKVITSVCVLMCLIYLGEGQTQIGGTQCPTLDQCLLCICRTQDPEEGCELTRAVHKNCQDGPNTLNKVGYEGCARNIKCTSLCLQNYLLAKTSKKCTGSKVPAQLTCADFARVHFSNGKKRKCNRNPAVKFGKNVNTCCDNIGCPTLDSCTNCICEAVAGEPGECEITQTLFRACRDGPVWIWMGFEACEDNPRCAVTCMNNILHTQSQMCTGVTDPSQVPCSELGRIFKTAPFGCPTKTQFTRFGKTVDQCCQGKITAGSAGSFGSD